MVMTKVLLINPPSELGYLNRDLMSGLGVGMYTERNFVDGLITHLKSVGRRMPVTSLGYLSAILSKDAKIKVIDAANLGMYAEEVIKESEKFSPDFIFIVSSAVSLPLEVKIAEDIKRLINSTVGLIGGSAESFSKNIIGKHNIDFVIKGEPEIVASKIIEQKSFKNVESVVFKENRKVKDVGSESVIQNLNSLPFPKWEYFPIKKYGYFPILKRKPFITILSSRGCPYGCIYCPYTTFMGQQWRARTPDNVVKELKYLRKKYGVKSVLFRDPIFTLDKKRVTEICNKIINENIKIKWACETRLDCLDENLVELMALAGCEGINVGIESSDPKILSNVKRKPVPKEFIQKIVSRANKNGIKVTGFFILGLPGETKDTLINTIKFSMELGLAYAEYKVATPFPGTELYNMAVRNDWLVEKRGLSEFPSFTSYNAYIKLEDLSISDVEKFCADAFRQFYLRRGIIFRELLKGNFLNFSLIKETFSYTNHFLKNKIIKFK